MSRILLVARTALRGASHLPIMRNTLFAVRLVLAVFLVSTVALPGRAWAHGGGSEVFQTFTQKVGPYEIALTLDMPPTAPAPLFIDIVPPPDLGEAMITLRAVPRGYARDDTPTVDVMTTAAAGTIYYAELAVDRLGDSDLIGRTDCTRVPSRMANPNASAYCSRYSATASLAGWVSGGVGKAISGKLLYCAGVNKRSES